jgi:hypothetical protein
MRKKRRGYSRRECEKKWEKGKTVVGNEEPGV